MQKLRSMTETIKMLSDENQRLRNKEIEVTEQSQKEDKHGDYENLTKPELISLVVSYDEKLKALSSELSSINKAKQPQQQPPKTQDKYKALARRLKEERNQYKETCEQKL